MKSRFLQDPSNPYLEGNIFADKSAIVLDWLLSVGVIKDNFSLRGVVREIPVSLGLVQRVFGNLVSHNLLNVVGVRTAKRFSLKSPDLLLKHWRDHYSIVKKCKMWTYSSGFANREEMLRELSTSDFHHKIAFALHSAAEVLGCKNTNLKTLELYMLEPGIRSQLVKLLELEPQERGYDVLLIEPYYKSLLFRGKMLKKGDMVSPPLLTFLDLYHFPLRGPEQAEFMLSHLPNLKRLYKRK